METQRQRTNVPPSYRQAVENTILPIHTKPPVPSDKQLNAYLQKLYHGLTPAELSENGSGAYAGYPGLRNAVLADGKYTISEKRLKSWLSSQESYALYKKAQRNFKRQRIVVGEKNNSVQSDTLNMKKFSKYNRDYAFILVVVEVMTRYAYTQPLKTLQASDTRAALEVIFKEAPKPEVFYCDGGSEYKKSVGDYLKAQGIKKVVTLNETKCPLAERFIQSLRLRLQRYFRATDTLKWIDELEPMTQAYNHSRHRSLGGRITPYQAMCDTPTPLLYHWQYRRKGQAGPTRAGYQYDIGDRVRLSVLRKSFHRRYNENFTNEIFHVYARKKKQGFEVYKVKDDTNDPIEGEFYLQELQLVPSNDGVESSSSSSLSSSSPELGAERQTVNFEVQEILDTRMTGLAHQKSMEYLVKWKGKH